jgi:hypothetical protein
VLFFICFRKGVFIRRRMSTVIRTLRVSRQFDDVANSPGFTLRECRPPHKEGIILTCRHLRRINYPMFLQRVFLAIDISLQESLIPDII